MYTGNVTLPAGEEEEGVDGNVDDADDPEDLYVPPPPLSPPTVPVEEENHLLHISMYSFLWCIFFVPKGCQISQD